MNRTKDLADSLKAERSDDWEGYEIETVQELFSDIDDPRVHHIILSRAEGLTWKASAEKAGVTAATAFNLRHAYPIDARAAALALEATTAGALRMMRAYATSAAYICSVVEDGGARPGDRLTAAKAILSEVRAAAGGMQAHTAGDHRTPSEGQEGVIDASPSETPGALPGDASVASRIRARRSKGNA